MGSREAHGLPIAYCLLPPSGRLRQVPQHVMENPAVTEVFELVHRVDPRLQADAGRRPEAARDLGLEHLARPQLPGQPTNCHFFITDKAKHLPAFAFLELQRNDAHADEVGAVNALEGLGDDRPDAEQPRALGRPVAR